MNKPIAVIGVRLAENEPVDVKICPSCGAKVMDVDRKRCYKCNADLSATPIAQIGMEERESDG